jgi:Ca2+-binding EF-hand superfamily protein
MALHELFNQEGYWASVGLDMETVKRSRELIEAFESINVDDVTIEAFLQFAKERIEENISVNEMQAATVVIFAILAREFLKSNAPGVDAILEFANKIDQPQYENMRKITLSEFLKILAGKILKEKPQETEIQDTKPIIEFIEELNSVRINGVIYKFGSYNPYALFKLLCENMGGWIDRDEATRKVYNLSEADNPKQRIGQTLSTLKRGLAEINVKTGANLILRTLKGNDGVERLMLVVPEETLES